MVHPTPPRHRHDPHTTEVRRAVERAGYSKKLTQALGHISHGHTMAPHNMALPTPKPTPPWDPTAATNHAEKQAGKEKERLNPVKTSTGHLGWHQAPPSAPNLSVPT